MGEEEGPKLVGTATCKICKKVAIVRSDGSVAVPCEHLQAEVDRVKQIMKGIPGIKVLCYNPDCVAEDGAVVMVNNTYNKSLYSCPNCGSKVAVVMEGGK